MDCKHSTEKEKAKIERLPELVGKKLVGLNPEASGSTADSTQNFSKIRE